MTNGFVKRSHDEIRVVENKLKQQGWQQQQHHHHQQLSLQQQSLRRRWQFVVDAGENAAETMPWKVARRDSTRGFVQEVIVGSGDAIAEVPARTSALEQEGNLLELQDSLGKNRVEGGKKESVKLEIAAPGGRFHVPREIATSEEQEPPADRGKAVKGFALVHKCKQERKVSPRVGSSSRPVDKHPRRSKRVFSQKALFEDDPPTMKLNRTNNTPTDACERISLYLVIVTSFLQPDNPSQERAIKDIDNYLSLIPQAVDTLVEHFQFDIKPARFLT